MDRLLRVDKEEYLRQMRQPSAPRNAVPEVCGSGRESKEVGETICVSARIWIMSHCRVDTDYANEIKAWKNILGFDVVGDDDMPVP
jgi:hypothetical protein